MTEPRDEMEAAIERAVAEALATYAKTHRVGPAERRDAAADFRQFYLAAIVGGLRGIRWNFNGCLFCPKSTTPRRMRRILSFDPQVIAAAGGRALGAGVCANHEGYLNPARSEDLRKACLARLVRDPA